jgi:hypothetical protein
LIISESIGVGPDAINIPSFVFASQTIFSYLGYGASKGDLPQSESHQASFYYKVKNKCYFYFSLRVYEIL